MHEPRQRDDLRRCVRRRRLRRQPGCGARVALEQGHQREVGGGDRASPGARVGGVQRGRQRLPRGVEPAGQRLELTEDAVEPRCRGPGAQVGFRAQRAGELTAGEHRADGEDEPGAPLLRRTAQVGGRREPVRGVAPPARADLGPAQGGELGGEHGIRSDGRGDPVVHRGVAAEQPRRGPVQRVPAAGRQVGVHRRPDQLVREGDVVRGAGQHLVEQPRPDRLVQRRERVGRRGERDDVGQARAPPEHGRRHDQVLRGPRQLGHPDQHEGREGAGCGQDPRRVGERVGGARSAAPWRAADGRRCGRAGACRPRGSAPARRPRPTTRRCPRRRAPRAGCGARGGPASARAPTTPTRAVCRPAPRPRRGPGRGAAVARRTRAPAPSRRRPTGRRRPRRPPGPRTAGRRGRSAARRPPRAGPRPARAPRRAAARGTGGARRRPAGPAPRTGARSRPRRRRPAGRGRRRGRRGGGGRATSSRCPRDRSPTGRAGARSGRGRAPRPSWRARRRGRRTSPCGTRHAVCRRDGARGTGVTAWGTSATRCHHWTPVPRTDDAPRPRHRTSSAVSHVVGGVAPRGGLPRVLCGVRRLRALCDSALGRVAHPCRASHPVGGVASSGPASARASRRRSRRAWPPPSTPLP